MTLKALLDLARPVSKACSWDVDAFVIVLEGRHQGQLETYCGRPQREAIYGIARGIREAAVRHEERELAREVAMLLGRLEAAWPEVRKKAKEEATR